MCSRSHQTSLHEAVERNSDPQLIRDLLDEFEVNNSAGNLTPLHIAAQQNNLKLVLVLLENGASVNAVSHCLFCSPYDDYGDTPLHKAAKRNSDPQIVRLLLEYGADVNATNRTLKTALHHAVKDRILDDGQHRSFNKETVRILLEHGASVSAKDVVERTPLDYAVEKCDADIVEMLLDNGSVVRNESIYIRRETTLHFAARNGDVKVVQLLLGKSASANARNVDEDTPLHIAAKFNNNPEVLQILLDNGGSMFAFNTYGQIPLHYAAANKNSDMIQFFMDLEVRADEVDHQGRTPLFFAASAVIVDILVANGASVTAVANSGKTPLDTAADAQVVRALLANGAAVEAVDRRSGTPLRSTVESQLAAETTTSLAA